MVKFISTGTLISHGPKESQRSVNKNTFSYGKQGDDKYM